MSKAQFGNQHGLTHGHAKNHKPSRTWLAWRQMRQRCQDPKHKSYADYGGRGILVCDEWATFERFLLDMGERPDGKGIDRRDNDKGYSKNNCRWAAAQEQQQNKRNNRNITYNGETHCSDEWARRVGLKVITLHKRLLHGWDVERALTTPARPVRR